MAASNRKRTVKKGKKQQRNHIQAGDSRVSDRDYFVCDPGSLCDPSGQQFRNGRLCRGCHQSFLLWADGNDGISFSCHFLCRGSLYSDQ